MTARPEFEIAVYDSVDAADELLVVTGSVEPAADRPLSSEDMVSWRIALGQVTVDTVQNGDDFSEGSPYRKAWDELHQYRRDYINQERVAEDAEYRDRWHQTLIGRVALLFTRAG